MKINLSERQAMEALAASLGVHHHLVFKISPDEDGRDKSNGQQLSFGEMVALYNEMCAPFEPRPGDPSSRTCSVGLSSCLIDPYGTVLPCVELRIPAGNLRTHSFADIWRNAPIFRELRERHTLANLPSCRTCALQPYCEGRCAGVAWKEHGDLYGPHTLACQQARARFHTLHPDDPVPAPSPMSASMMLSKG
jgi:radical SAM protein with 4Fe4S-binding SPASM domain